MPTKKKPTEPPLTLRQRMRIDAEKRLDKLLAAVEKKVESAIAAENAQVPLRDIMRVLSSQESKTLRVKLVTQITDQMERELEQLYNQQLGLPIGDDGGKEAETEES